MRRENRKLSRKQLECRRVNVPLSMSRESVNDWDEDDWAPLNYIVSAVIRL